MKILNILRDGSDPDAAVVIGELAKANQVEVIDLSRGAFSYDALVDEIERCDKVISW